MPHSIFNRKISSKQKKYFLKLMLNLLTNYQYLYYKFYASSVWWRRGKDPFSYQTGLYVITTLSFMNFLTLLALSEVLTGFGYEQICYSKLNAVLLGSTILFINYALLVRNEKYLKIIKKFRNEDKKTRIKGNIYALLYVVFTLLLLGFSGFLVRIFRH